VAAGVALLEAPGESPGHQCVRVGGVLYLGDLVHSPEELQRVELASGGAGRDPALAAESRRRVLAEAEGADAVVFTHARFPAWGRVERDGAAWRWLALGD
jgi:glyoxylase-like metal-dependent hydrolase (beta-lactamase superfamily II)